MPPNQILPNLWRAGNLGNFEIASQDCGSASPSLSTACLGSILDVLTVTHPGTQSIWGKEISRRRREGGALFLMQAARQQEPGVVLVAHGDGISSHELAPPQFQPFTDQEGPTGRRWGRVLEPPASKT